MTDARRMPAPARSDAGMRLDGITVRFGGLRALDGVTCEVAAGEICGLIGPNGAGKTTLFNVLTRLVEPVAGELRFGGIDLLRHPAHAVSALGIARTFQNVALLDSLPVRGNVKLGSPSQRGAGVLTGMLLPSAGRERALDRAVDELLERLDLAAVADARPAELPFGTRKRVELARALMAEPRLLLLDEPANGLTAQEVVELGCTLRALRDERTLTIVLVEHHMGLVQEVADHAVVLDFGRVIAAGDPTWACAQPQVVEAYLGAPA